MMSEPGKKKQGVLLALLILINFSTEAQTLKDHLTKGDRHYQRKDYRNAIDSFLEALKLDDTNAQTNYKTGMSYLNEEDFEKAAQYLEKSYRLDPGVDPNVDYHLGMAYQEVQEYKKALDHYKALKARNKNLAPVANQKILECTFADSLMKIPSHATVRPLPDPINTPFSESFPLATRDGKTLIFSSNRSGDDYQIKSATNPHDVYIVEKEGNDWSPPRKIGPGINVKSNDVATSLSADGKTLFLYYEEGQGDIYTSTLENGSWTQPVALNRFINHPQYRESAACISEDGKRLFFSSNRAGGRGGYDIYVCQLGENGQWGRPANLGSTVNTRRDEDTPFLDKDGTTLYFSSNGHPALGNRDIFRSTLQNGKWTKPENMGHPINTPGDDTDFVLTGDGKTGYYTRHRAPGNTDLFYIELTPSTASNGGAMSASGSEKGIVTVLKGTVIDVTSMKPLAADITLVDNSNKRIVSSMTTADDGVFELVIPHGGNYGVTTGRQGYLFNSMNFNLPPFQKFQEIDTHILMVKAEVGSKIVLKNIFFDLNQSALKAESMAELENIRDLLRQNPGWRIQINGHTDNVGHPKTNLDLSLKRAESVVQYLIREGIAPERLRAKGFGSERPLVSNDDEADGRQINRRTEIEIID